MQYAQYVVFVLCAVYNDWDLTLTVTWTIITCVCTVTCYRWLCQSVLICVCHICIYLSVDLCKKFQSLRHKMGKKIQNALFEALEKRAIMELIAMFENLNIIGNDERDTPNASMEHMHMSRDQTSRFHHTILPTVAGSFFISRAVFKYIKLPPYFLAFHGQNNAFSRAVFRFLRLPP